VEFEVADEAAGQAAADELRAAGYELVHGVRTEPWGQTVARLLTDDGVIVGISFVPSFHS
jgi:catechol 2,3-dioxygenase-like lactoylglutathione lyase family enzyme